MTGPSQPQEPHDLDDGDVITDPWVTAVSSSVVQRFPDADTRAQLWPQPPDGAVSFDATLRRHEWYDATADNGAGAWEPLAGGSTPVPVVLSDLADVTDEAPVGGQYLRYDDEAGLWVPAFTETSLGIASFPYRFDTDTDNQPNRGRVQLNHADPAQATELYIHTDPDGGDGGNDISTFLDFLTPLSWFNLFDRDDDQNAYRFDVLAEPTQLFEEVYSVPITLEAQLGAGLSDGLRIIVLMRFASVENDPT